MKTAQLLLVLSVVTLVVSKPSHHTENDSCPPGEHARADCPQFYEPWCTNPTFHPLEGKMARVCLRPPCFCDEPNVRNLDTGKCVPISECPTTA